MCILNDIFISIHTIHAYSYTQYNTLPALTHFIRFETCLYIKYIIIICKILLMHRALWFEWRYMTDCLASGKRDRRKECVGSSLCLVKHYEHVYVRKSYTVCVEGNARMTICFKFVLTFFQIKLYIFCCFKTQFTNRKFY